MPQRHWKPTGPGKFFTRTADWGLTLSANKFLLQVGDNMREGSVLEIEQFQVSPGTFWATVNAEFSGGHSVSLDGIPNAPAKEMSLAVAHAQRRARVARLLSEFDGAIEPVVEWANKARGACKGQLASKGWLTQEFKAAQNSCKPGGLRELLAEPEVARHIATQSQEITSAVDLWQRDFGDVADGINERHLAKELQDFKAFFSQVESSTLSEEQAKAVVCFDNRVLLVASAGSGKTSTMVAKAGYALKKGYFEPDKILLLAFNKDAATELRKRSKARLEPLGLAGEKVAAKTFHAFGLEIVGAATGRRPSVAPWLEDGQDLEVLMDLVDGLKDQDDAFKSTWDLFRVVFGQDLPKFGKEHESPDAWDRERKTEGFWTLNNEVVKSRGEQLIANWLFYNGVSYQYEAPYCVETADARHRQYQPDFYLPDIDTYLEHWAVDENGNPPPQFKGYKEAMAWKRKLHAEHGTKLLETTMADLWSGKAFQYLAQALTGLGVTLDPNPDRPAKGRKPIESPRLTRTFRTFLTHAKSNRLTMPILRQRMQAGVAGHFRFRHQMFLGIFEKVWAAWEERLKKERCIDFEGMLGLAADCLESGQWQSPYELVMVDEFQDVSQARARLVAGLMRAPGRCLFGVGDDWQSINRFAGSDLAVMTEFEAKFGKAVTLKLETTFRCPQSLCDVSSAFIQKNPHQLGKRVRSAKPDVAECVRIVRVDDEAKIQTAIASRIRELAEEHALAGQRLRIYVLGRYNKDKDYLPLGVVDDKVDVKFVTVHSSKGLEADHVIIPKMTSEILGFPSQIEDDPVLQLAMPAGDTFENAEERRLFYVALTRARSTVTLITLTHQESPFIAELVRDYKLGIHDVDGELVLAQVCPECREGFMVQRTSEYGLFLGCSRFPKCRHTEDLPSRQHAKRRAAYRARRPNRKARKAL